MLIDDPENPGQQIEVVPKTDHDKALADKDAHVAEKLKEFQTGKSAQELKDIERDVAIKEARDAATAAAATANATVEGARKKVVEFVAQQFVGEDPELRKKLDDAFGIIEEGRKAKGLDVKDDKSIQEMMTAAANMAGINSISSPSFPMHNGIAPNFQKTASELSDAEHKAFLAATGYQSAPNPIENK